MTGVVKTKKYFITGLNDGNKVVMLGDQMLVQPMSAPKWCTYLSKMRKFVDTNRDIGSNLFVTAQNYMLLCFEKCPYCCRMCSFENTCKQMCSFMLRRSVVA